LLAEVAAYRQLQGGVAAPEVGAADGDDVPAEFGEVVLAAFVAGSLAGVGVPAVAVVLET
jgi:hypothetical protein